LEAARSAGVGLVVGVLSGAHDSEQLKALPSDVIIPSVADLPGLLSLKNRP
jgi:phosphoglycolate phosphatase-like HAD superfamily hydrolase